MLRTSFLLNLLIENGKHIMIVGPTGTGKTATIKDLLLNKLDKQKYFPMFVTLSHQSSANSVQEIIETKLVKLSHETGIFGPPDKKKGILFVDDLNMPAKERYGAQPPLELLRQTLDHGGWYDLKTNAFKEIANTQMICSMQAEGKEPITSRLIAKFSVITVQSFDDSNLQNIFNDIVATFLSQRGVRNGVIYQNSSAIVNASVELYRSVCNELLPTPSKFYYTFNLRDLSKIFQGVLSVPLDSISKRDQLVRLWAHECYRVFGDRLVTKDDQDFFAGHLNVVAQKHFEETYEHALQLSLTKNNPTIPFSVFAGNDISHISKFQDFLNSSAASKQYTEVNEPGALRNVLNEYLEDYMMYSNAVKSKLVLFDDAMLHLSRICRILRQPAGHALLVGVPGT